MLAAGLPGYLGATANHRQGLRRGSLSLGTDEAETAFHVTIPLMMPAIIGGLMLAFTVSFDEFSATQFVVTPFTQTIPIQIYSMIQTGIDPAVNVFATFLTGVTIMVPLVAQYLFSVFRPRR
jgi:spermidine/putrescine transport system permease protein